MDEREGGDMAWIVDTLRLDFDPLSALGRDAGSIVCLLISLAASVSRVSI